MTKTHQTNVTDVTTPPISVNLASDLHLEYIVRDSDMPCIINTHQARVLILAGDITTLERLKEKNSRSTRFFEECCDNYETVIYTPGNHEYYGSDLKDANDQIRDALGRFDQVKLLLGQTTTVNDWTFYGDTFWTDCNNSDPITMRAAASEVHDYEYIRWNGRDLKATDTVGMHLEAIYKLKTFLNSSDVSNKILISHHALTPESTDERYRGKFYANGLFSSNYNDLLFDSDLSLIAHGHTHSRFDYLLGGDGPRVVCNPRGYIKTEYDKVKSWHLKNIEVAARPVQKAARESGLFMP